MDEFLAWQASILEDSVPLREAFHVVFQSSLEDPSQRRAAEEAYPQEASLFARSQAGEIRI